MKKVNLNNILSSQIPESLKREGYSFGDVDEDWIIKAMKEACRQTLESASENAICIVNDDNMYTEGIVTADVDKQSILDIINQIK